MRVGAVKFNQLYNKSISKRNIYFKGVNADSYDPTSVDTKNNSRGSEIVNKFNKELNKIRKAASDKKNNIGAFSILDIIITAQSYEQL